MSEHPCVRPDCLRCEHEDGRCCFCDQASIINRAPRRDKDDYERGRQMVRDAVDTVMGPRKTKEAK